MNKILIINADSQEFPNILQDKYEVTHKLNFLDIEKNLSEENYNLVIFCVKDNLIETINNIEKIKKNKDISYTCIFVLDYSAYAIPENISLALRTGADDYLFAKKQSNEIIPRIEKLLFLHKKHNEILIKNKTLKETIDLIDRFRLIIDKADNSFVIINKTGEIEWANKGFKKIYNCDIDEFRKKYGNTIFKFSNNPNIKKDIEKCVQTKKSINYIAEGLVADEKFKWIQTTITPIFLNNGGIDKFVLIESDITEIKEAEEALNQKNEYMQALTNHLKSTNILLEEQQKEINAQNEALAKEQEKSESLLLNILPYEVARQLKSKGVAKPRNYRFSTILFLDFVKFTQISQELSPKDLVHKLDSYFSIFDDIISRHYIEKIKTVGDAYLCVGGLPLSNKSNPFNVVLAALEINKYIKDMIEENKTPKGKIWECRIGIHTGEVIAGVVGKTKYLYDIWGNTVNIAARTQQIGEIGRINTTGETHLHIKDYFECEYRGEMAVKHSKKEDMYFVNRIKPKFAEDKEGIFPNQEFLKMINSL